MGELKEAIGNWAHEAAKNAGWIMALGALTVVAGLLAMGSPLATGLVVVVLIGIALLIGGVTRSIAAFSAGSFGLGALAFIGGILTFGAGMILVGRPSLGLTTLTLLLGAYLVVDGISSAVLAFQLRPNAGWGAMLFSATMGILFGFLVLREWPLSGAWAIGTMVGANMVLSGFSLITFASGVRTVAKAAA